MAAGLPGDMSTAYDTVVQSLSDASIDSNCGYVFWLEPVSSRFKAAGDDVNFDLKLHLCEWPARNEKLSILIWVRETIDRATRTLKQSSVLICYYDVQGIVGKHLHSMHFDFKGEELRHPIFHAQLCKDTVPLTPEEGRALGVKFTPEPPTSTCFRECRIPTSDMSFASLLLCVAGDHLSKDDEFFNKFLADVRREQVKLPKLTFASLKKSLTDQPDHFKSSHWYSHM